MKIVIAADSFKNCLSGREVVAALAAGFRHVLPRAVLVELPLADGGEGTVNALVSACGGEFREAEVSGPLATPVKAQYGVIDAGKTAVIEMAAASGIELLALSELNPLKTSTRGTGELIAAALASGVQKIIIGIGGSATCDGGAGMAQALGYRFYDSAGRLLEEPLCGGALDAVAAIEPPDSAAFRDCEICVACDVINPLLGKNGCVNVFAPQKGATPEMLPVLERNLAHFAEQVIAAGLAQSCDRPGDGAAGGLGFGLRAFLGGGMASGAALVLAAAGFERQVKDADWVVTGEGKTDDQTLSGKLCFTVAETAKRHGVPTIVVSGAVGGDPDALLRHFFAAFSIAPGPCALESALRDARQNLFRTAANLGRLLGNILVEGENLKKCEVDF